MGVHSLTRWLVTDSTEKRMSLTFTAQTHHPSFFLVDTLRINNAFCVGYTALHIYLSIDL